MLTGIELMTDERQEQIEDHGRTIKWDVLENENDQLIDAAKRLLMANSRLTLAPYKWDTKLWNHMKSKPLKDRIIIAGALLAAHIDRLQWIEEHK